MTGDADHYTVAAKLVDANRLTNIDDDSEAAFAVQVAQVHATLAVADQLRAIATKPRYLQGAGPL